MFKREMIAAMICCISSVTVMAAGAQINGSVFDLPSARNQLRLDSCRLLAMTPHLKSQCRYIEVYSIGDAFSEWFLDNGLVVFNQPLTGMSGGKSRTTIVNFIDRRTGDRYWQFTSVNIIGESHSICTAEKDTFRAGTASAIIRGCDGDDVIYTSGYGKPDMGRVYAFGDAGNDTIYCGKLRSNEGSAVCAGGDGRDVFIMNHNGQVEDFKRNIDTIRVPGPRRGIKLTRQGGYTAVSISPLSGIYERIDFKVNGVTAIADIVFDR